jgi:hypothetical protein
LCQSRIATTTRRSASEASSATALHPQPCRRIRALRLAPNGDRHHERTGSSLTDSLDDFAGFYFDTALSSTASALPSLLAFAKPGHVTFGSDFPFAPVAAGKLFAAGLETYPGLDPDARAAIDRTNALALFPRLGAAPPSDAGSVVDHVRHAASRAVMRGVARLVNIR